MKLANRIFISFMWIIILSVLMSAVVGSVLISKTVWSDAITRVRLGLKEAHSYLDERLKELSLSAEILSEGVEKQVPLPMTADFTVIDRTKLKPLLSKLRIDKKNAEGYALIPLSLLDKLKILKSDKLSGNGSLPLCSDGSVLCMFSLKTGEVGPVFSAVILNGNVQLIEHLQQSLFYEGYYGNKPFGTVTIFCRDTRINTTVIGPGGKIAVGTKVSDVVKKRVLNEGKMWLDRAYVVDEWYISAYEPIKNTKSQNIGILYVGVLEKWYTSIRRTIILSLSSIIIPALGLMIFVVFMLARGIGKPLTSLAEASNRIAAGELSPVKGVWEEHSEIGVLAASFNSMVEAIKDRERKLKSKNIELVEANTAYQELLSFVTHELNNSIGSLLLNISILADGTAGELSEEQGEVASLVLRDVERFKDMVRNYLNLSRLEKGTLKYNPVRLKLKHEVVEPVVLRFKSRLEHRGIKVIWDWDDDPEVTGDQELLDICYSNLIVNAIKYGKYWLKLTARKEKDSRGKESLVLGVLNGGEPIPEDKISLLFKKFSRLVKSDDGAGLGLYLIKKIVERHGGTVWCKPLEGTVEERGTGFYIKLAIV